MTPEWLSRAYTRSHAARWSVDLAAFGAALDASIAHQFDEPPAETEIAAYVETLHLEDLALACGCAAGCEPAWEHFIREQRPGLYRAADAIDPSGAARDLADALYADLYGLREGDTARQSLFRYFYGRSRLSTWLRAVLAQRYVDRLRAERRLDPLPEDDVWPLAARLGATRPDAAAPERARLTERLRAALVAAIAALAPRDRLRLKLYYGKEMKLAAIGRMFAEHEATVSRHLARTRRVIRETVERRLRDDGLDDAGIAECFHVVLEDPGPIDLDEVIGPTPAVVTGGKNAAADRSR